MTMKMSQELRQAASDIRKFAANRGNDSVAKMSVDEIARVVLVISEYRTAHEVRADDLN